MSIAHNEIRRIPPLTLRLRLQLAREWRGLNQIDLAEALDVSRATVSNYETGKTEPSKLQINAWAVTCDVDVDWIKTGNESTGTDPENGGRLRESNSRPIHYKVTSLHLAKERERRAA